MKIKFYVKSTCALLISFLTSVSSFAMQSPTKMPDFARSMFMEMHKPLSDEIKLAKLDNYMHEICKKIFAPDNTNSMVKWARQHSKPEDVNKTIYQIWENGPKCTKSDINCNSILGKEFYVLPKELRTQASRDSQTKTSTFIKLAIKILYKNYVSNAKAPVCTEEEFKSKIYLNSLKGDNTLRYKVDEMLQQGNCWYSFNQPGTEFWTEKVTKELIGNRNVILREMIDILSKTAERTDFFGNCIIGACIAYKKCEELGLSCDFARFIGNDGQFHYTVIINGNAKRYIINYSAGVLNIAANGVIHKDIIQEIDDEEYRKLTIPPLDMKVKMKYYIS